MATLKTYQEASREFNISIKRIRQWVSQGLLQQYLISSERRIYIMDDDVIETVQVAEEVKHMTLQEVSEEVVEKAKGLQEQRSELDIATCIEATLKANRRLKKLYYMAVVTKGIEEK